MKHAKRTRAETIAGKGSCKHETEAPNRQAECQSQAALVMATIDGVILHAKGDAETRRRLYCLRQQMVCFMQMVGRQVWAADRTGAGTKVETEAHSELLKACHEAGDLFYMMGLTLAGHLEGTPGEGSGVQDLAATAADRLMECLSAAMEENRRNGGGR